MHNSDKKYEKDEFTKEILQPAREFVELLQYSTELSSLMEHIHNILVKLEKQTKIPVRIKNLR